MSTRDGRHQRRVAAPRSAPASVAGLVAASVLCVVLAPTARGGGNFDVPATLAAARAAVDAVEAVVLRRLQRPFHLAPRFAGEAARDEALARGEHPAVAEGRGAFEALNAGAAARYVRRAGLVTAAATAAAEALTQAGRALEDDDFDVALGFMRQAVTADPGHAAVQFLAQTWLSYRGDERAHWLSREMMNIVTGVGVAGVAEDATPGGEVVTACAMPSLARTAMPALPDVLHGARDDAELARLLERGFDAVQGPVGALSTPDSKTCRELGSPLFYLAYADVPQLGPQRAYQAMLYRAFPSTLEFVADHLRPMFRDARGEEPGLPGRDPERPDAARAALRALADERARVRVGVVSYFMTPQHAVTKSFGGVFGRLPRDDFELRVFSLNADLPPAREEFLSLGADATVADLGGLDLPSSRDAIAAWRPHVLFFTDMGMTSLSDRIAMARLAPVQVLGVGHPVTSGLYTLDAFMDPLAPNAVAEHLHSEAEVVRLRCTGSLREKPLPPDGAGRPLGRARFGLPGGGARLYVCAQTLFKVHPVMDAAFAGILSADANAHVVFIHTRMHPRMGDTLMARLRRNLPADSFSRVHMLPTVPTNASRAAGVDYDLNEHYPDLLLVADVMLDTHPFTGGTSSIEALAFAQPIVTWPAPSSRGRHTLSYYRLMDTFDLIVNDVPEYIATAVRVATDGALRRRLRNKLASRNPVLHSTDTADEYAAVFKRFGARARQMAREALADMDQ